MHVPGLEHAYVPPASGGAPRTLALVMHGRGDSIDGFTFLPDALGLPDVGYMLVQAPDPYFGGWSWYDLPPDQGPGILRSRGLLFTALDALRAQGVAAGDIALYGFSQGCLMAIDVGLRYPHRLAGVCGASGYVMWPEQAAAEATAHAKEMPWLISAGSFDQVVPYDLTAEGVAAIKEAGVPVDFRTYRKAHTIDPKELADQRAWLAALHHSAP